MEKKKGIFGFARLTTGGFTLIELLVVIAIIVLLMGILLPFLTRARRQGKRAVCLSNIRQFQTAWLAYAEAHDGRIVNGAGVRTILHIRRRRATGAGRTGTIWPTR